LCASVCGSRVCLPCATGHRPSRNLPQSAAPPFFGVPLLSRCRSLAMPYNNKRSYSYLEHGTPCRYRNGDRKSTRLNSSHVKISYAVFCLKKKKAIEMFLDST